MALNMGLKEDKYEFLEKNLIQMKVGEGLIINNPKFDIEIGEEIKKILEGEEKVVIETFENYLICKLNSGYFILETNESNFEILDNYKKFIDENFNSDGMHCSEKIDGDKQIPESSGFFEYKGSFYIVIYPYNDLTNEINEDNGVYRGMIINPEKYYEVKEGIKEVKGEIENVHYINQ